jgi:undecaprenyl-diphosphatase
VFPLEPDLGNLIHAALLGVVEGITEFLPISSTGHLIVLVDIFGVRTPPGRVFEVVIQLGAILAVCWLYRARLWHTLRHLHDAASARHFALLVAVGFLPSAMVGATLHGFIKSVLFSPLVVALMLVVGGVLILLVERWKPPPRTVSVDTLSLRQAVLIGCFQALAVIPGTSRSAATILGALLLGVERKAAAEFSFFLAIPTMLGATVLDLYKNYHQMTDEGAVFIALGFVSAFCAALLSVRFLIGFVSRHGFAPFAWYRIILGLGLLYFFLA